MSENVRVNRKIEYNKNEKKINHQTTTVIYEEEEKIIIPNCFLKKKNGKFNNFNHLNYTISTPK